MSDLTFDGAMQLFGAQTSEPFPVDFDKAWQWLAFTRKDNAKRSLLSCGFVEGIDLLINEEALDQGFQPLSANKQFIFLTVDCFKQWGMMAGTEQGKQIRRYFLECEQIAKMKASAPNLQDVADPFWQIIDGAIARNIAPEHAISLKLLYDGKAAQPSTAKDLKPSPTNVEAVKQFCKDCGFVVASSRNSFVEIKEIWEAYGEWAETHDVRLFSKAQDIFPALCAAFPKVGHDRHPKTRRALVRGLQKSKPEAYKPAWVSKVAETLEPKQA